MLPLHHTHKKNVESGAFKDKPLFQNDYDRYSIYTDGIELDDNIEVEYQTVYVDTSSGLDRILYGDEVAKEKQDNKNTDKMVRHEFELYKV